MAIYAVTGGAGFIGSHLTDALLAGGHGVRVLDDLSTGRMDNLDPRCTLVRGDVADPGCVRAALEGTAGCFHLAAIASVVRGQEDWPGTHRVNAGGTVAVLDAARAGGRIPVVYASSAAIYGDAAAVPVGEDTPPAPLTAYGADKRASELHARVAWLDHGVPTAGLRFFNVFGPRQDPHSPYSGVISIFAQRIAAGEPVTIHGDGQQTRDFIFVADVVAHLLAAMRRLEAHQGGADLLNVCTGRETAIAAVAETIGHVLGRKPTLLPGPARGGDIRRSAGDPARAIAILGVQARTGLEAGLAALLGA